MQPAARQAAEDGEDILVTLDLCPRQNFLADEVAERRRRHVAPHCPHHRHRRRAILVGREPVGADVGRITARSAGDVERPAASRAQHRSINGDAGARIDLVERDRVVIVADREGVAAKVKLDIGASVGIGDIEERPHLKRAGRHDPAPGQRPARHRRDQPQPGKAALCPLPAGQPEWHRQRQMLDHPLAHVRRLHQRHDARRRQLVRIADTRSLEQQRAFDGAATDDDLATAIKPLPLARDRYLDPGRAAIVEQDALGQRVGDDRQVRPATGAVEEGAGRALPFTASDIVTVEADPRTGRAVEVVDPLEADRFARLDHPVG